MCNSYKTLSFVLFDLCTCNGVCISSFRANWVKVCGTEYRTPFVLLIGHDEYDGDPKFGKVYLVYADGLVVLFEFLPMVTEQFHAHTHSYLVSLPPVTDRDTFLIRHTDLLDYHPYGLYTLSSHHHIIVRSRMFTQQ